MAPGVISACYSPERLSAQLPGPGSWRPYPAVRDRAAWEAVHRPTRDHLLAEAARILADPWPVLTATGYARFSRDGDRQGYERPYFARRTRLAAAVLTAALAGPAEERIGEVIDGIWLLCEETSWCLPAHDLFASREGTPLPDPAQPYLDLFAAETAGLLACTDLLAGDLIQGAVRDRLRDEVRTRVLDPYRDSDDWWWFGLRGRDLNNWTPWIHANLLLASLLLDRERRDIVTTAGRAAGALDRYLDAVPDDGGCDEGIGYWWLAGGCLFECLATLASACGGDGVFEAGKIRAIARYPVIAHIAGEWHVNFADGPARPDGTAPHLLYRFGRATGDEEVARHARALRGGRREATGSISGGPLARLLAAAFDAEWAQSAPQEFPMPAQAWLPATGVLTARSLAGSAAGLFLAAKAGHNAESHNHNDVGSFIVALDGRPLLIDVGVGVYTGQTFGPGRYEIWTMQSSWHNGVPEVDGVAQSPGRERAARHVRGRLSPGAAELSADLAGAYPPGAGLVTWHRTIRLDRDGAGGGRILLDDAWHTAHDPERIVVHLVAAGEPRPWAAGRLLLAAGEGASLVIGYPAADFGASIEERRIDDPRLALAWGSHVYRITLLARRPAAQGGIRLEISGLGERP